jgi:hypothetical protein
VVRQRSIRENGTAYGGAGERHDLHERVVLRLEEVEACSGNSVGKDIWGSRMGGGLRVPEGYTLGYVLAHEDLGRLSFDSRAGGSTGLLRWRLSKRHPARM